jgi:hypothetical protein
MDHAPGVEAKRRADLTAMLVLVALCWLCYWRLLTAAPLDQQSLVEGDFSGQFVAFAHYQAERLGAGEVPLWNPYNLGGHPFLADTQSAVFYPPRLATVALLNLTGGSTPGRMYDALQKEMVAHTLIASLLMYAFIRRLTRDEPHSVAAGLVGALTFAYGGYLTGYPQLQLAVMEAGVWLPLALLGILEATRGPRIAWRWLVIAGLALALSLLAGHPQTSLFLIYVSLAFLGWQTAAGRHGWQRFVLGAAIFGLIGGGIAAVQLLPGWEYLGLTSREALSFDARGNGFPFHDVFQVFVPGVFSLWSPLYFGVAGLMLALYGALRFRSGVAFWLIVAGVALGLSFGRGTVVYDAFHNLAPGFNLFRGQERAAYVFSAAMAILAGLGAAAILRDTASGALARRYVLLFSGMAAAAASLSAAVFIQWLGAPDEVAIRFERVSFGLLATLLAAGVLIALATWRGRPWVRWRTALLIGLIGLELFSFGRANPNLQSIASESRLPEPPLVTAMRADSDGVFRVDGVQGVRENYGTLYGVQDIRGISPLRLAAVESLLALPNVWRAWEVFAVRYVPADARELPVSSDIIDRDGPLNLHRLTAPRPFARLVYRVWVEPDDAAARGILNEPAFDSASTVILPAEPDIALLADPPDGNGFAEVISFAPERITLRTESSTAAILNVALVYYPGWEATVDGQPAPLLRADTAMIALALPAGAYQVELTFAPRTFSTGASISLASLLALGVFLARFLRRRS